MNELGSDFESYPEEYKQKQIKQRYEDWITRVPFVCAYSNVRYVSENNDNADTLQYVSKYYQYSNLTTLHDVIQISDYQGGFFDYYQRTIDKFGLIPRPYIQSIAIDCNSSAKSLRTIKLTIVCFSYQQFENIRPYFFVPATSIYVQFGYFMKKNAGSLYKPIYVKNVDEFVSKYQDDKSYLDENKLDTFMPQYETIIGVVHGFDISQEQKIIKVSVNMTTLGNSEMLNVIKPQYDAQEILKTNSLSNNTSASTSNKAKEAFKSDIEKIAANSVFSSAKQALRLDKDGNMFVTYNWIVNVIILKMRIILQAMQNVDLNIGILEPYVVFVPYPHFDNFNLISSDPDVIVLSLYAQQLPELGRDKAQNVIVNNLDDIKTTQQVYFDNLSLIQSQLKPQISKDQYINRYFNYLLTDIYDNKNNRDDAEAQYNNIKDKRKWGFFGNVYFKLNYVSQLITKMSSLSIDQLISQLNSKLQNALGGNIIFHYSFNHRSRLFTIQQSTLTAPIYNLSSTEDQQKIYRICNFGPNSVIKSITYDVKIPDSYKMTMLSTYGKQGAMQQLFKGMFGSTDVIPQDLRRYRILTANDQFNQSVVLSTQYQDTTAVETTGSFIPETTMMPDENKILDTIPQPLNPRIINKIGQ